MEETPTSTPDNESQKTVIDRVDIDLDDNNPSINTAPSRPFAKRKESRDSSLVWEHFTKVEGLPADSPKAACNYCGRQYYCHSKRNGTSSMISHLENQCKKYPYRFGVADKNQPTLSFDKKPEGEGNSSSSMIMHRYNP
jgi:hypothetical protein